MERGFYGICTDLDDIAPEIIKVNGGRWIIEDCFRITKIDLLSHLLPGAHPVQVPRKEDQPRRTALLSR
ncbi:MAG: hypothetical protein PUK70_10495 [Bacteroidales bacterium]|nr:hypothetical protein [Bacteroidales bacterium]